MDSLTERVSKIEQENINTKKQIDVDDFDEDYEITVGKDSISKINHTRSETRRPQNL